MHRRQLLDLLQNYESVHRQEHETVSRFRDFVESHADCFHRSQLAGHVTGSAWLVNRKGSHVLLTHHRKLNIWVQLGGHADGDSNVLEVALREAREESGIKLIETISERIFDIDIHQIPARGDEPEHYHYDVRYALQAAGSDTYSVSEESHALEWVEIAKMHERTNEESMRRMACKWRADH